MDYKYTPGRFPYDHLWYHEMKEKYQKEDEEILNEMKNKDEENEVLVSDDGDNRKVGKIKKRKKKKGKKRRQ